MKKVSEKLQEIADKVNSLPVDAREGVADFVDDIAKDNGPDIFLWANKADAHKDELSVDLFFFTKGYTVYATSFARELKAQSKQLFLYDVIGEVQTGAATGMRIVDLHFNTETDNYIGYADLDVVEHAQEVIEQIAYSEKSALGLWNTADFDLSRLKGIVARFTRKGEEPFYIIKLITPSNILKGSVAWEMNGEQMQQMRSDVALKITPDNQVLITDGRVFVFNEAKFTRLFGYEAGKVALLDSNIAKIESHFNLRYPEGMSLYSIAKESKALRDKLIACEPNRVKQEQLIDQADEFGLALMTDDENGDIIINDTKAAIMFADLLNDDYVGSNMTGTHYIATKKKEVLDTDVKQTGLDI